MVFEGKTKKKGKRPKYTSNEGVMIWENKDKNGNIYLSVRIPLLNISVNCFEWKQEIEEE